MKNIEGNPVPETIEEAKTLTYKQLEKACELFNSQQLSASDIQRAWNKHWWSGFNAAVDLVLQHIKQGGFFLHEELANQLAEGIMEEVNLYKNEV